MTSGIIIYSSSLFTYIPFFPCSMFGCVFPTLLVPTQVYTVVWGNVVEKLHIIPIDGKQYI